MRSIRTAALALLAILFVGIACSGEATNSSAAQRSVAELTGADGTNFLALSGAVRRSDEGLIMRMVAPQGRVEVTTSPLSDPSQSMLVDNVAPEGAVSLEIVQVVTDAEVEGCGSVAATLVCETARQAVGGACGEEGCPVGTVCNEGICAATRALDRCDATVSDDDEIPTRKRVEFNPERCTRSIFFVRPPETSRVRIAVAGAGDYTSVLAELRPDAEAGEVDLLILLGDNLPDANAAAVEAMSQAVLDFPVPVVALPGETESEVTEFPRFINRFGPGDFAFSYGPLRGVAFTSVGRHLGARGLDRIRSVVRLARQDDGGSREQPLIAFTHTPPIDPNGARDQGFTSEFQGAQTISLLNELGAEAIVAGHIPASDYGRFDQLDVIVTAADGSILEDGGEILSLEVGPATELEGTTVGDWAYVVQRVPR